MGRKTGATRGLTTLGLVLCAATPAALEAPPALGQGDANAVAIEQLTVTARRREETLQSVPGAVSGLSAARLQDLQAADLGDIQASVPNLTLHVGDASNAVVYIRGVGQIDSLAFADPGVGIYLDDVYLGRAQGAFLDVFDVERIEVLRGPQGTLYGRNTIGGAVKFVSRRPGEKTEYHASATVGSFDRLDLKAGLSGALAGDTLLGKATIAYLSRDGYSDNEFDGEDDGDKETVAWRASLLLNATDDFSIELSTDGSIDHPDTSRTPSRETPVFGFPANTDPFVVNANFNDLNDLEVWGVSGRAVWDAGDSVTVTSITAYREMQYDTHLDLDATPFDSFGVFVHQDQSQFSQELQASYDAGGRFNVVAGLYFFREHDVTESGIFGPVIAFISNSLNDQINRSFAAYGQGSYALTDRFSVTAGVRVTYEEKDFMRIQEFFAADTPLVPPLGQGLRITDVDTADDWTNVSPKFGVDYQISDDVLAYASVSRGFKSGGFDGRSNSADEAIPFDPETLWAYEVGIKSELFDRRAVVNVAAFYNDYTNLQLSSFVADEIGDFRALFTNAGKATMKGLEVELTARLTPELTVNGVLGLLDADYDTFIGPGGVDISDMRTPVNAPDVTARFGATYRRPVGNLGDLVLAGDVAYRSKVFPTVSSSEALAQDGYALLNAAVTFESADGYWLLSVGGKNLTDKEYIQHGFDLSDSLGYQLGYFGPPRTWAVTVTFKN